MEFPGKFIVDIAYTWKRITVSEYLATLICSNEVPFRPFGAKKG
jgi:hypothetical protein